MSVGEAREVFFEFTPIGSTVKVVAIDAATGTEVSVSDRPARPKPIWSNSPSAS